MLASPKKGMDYDLKRGGVSGLYVTKDLQVSGGGANWAVAGSVHDSMKKGTGNCQPYSLYARHRNLAVSATAGLS